MVNWLGPMQRHPVLSERLREILAKLDPSRLGLSPKIAGLAEIGGTYAGAYLLRRGLYMPWELSGVMDPEMARVGLLELDPMQVIQKCLMPDPGNAFARLYPRVTPYMRNQLLRDTDWTGRRTRWRYAHR